MPHSVQLNIHRSERIFFKMISLESMSVQLFMSLFKVSVCGQCMALSFYEKIYDFDKPSRLQVVKRNEVESHTHDFQIIVKTAFKS